jgi:hypothetical protein
MVDFGKMFRHAVDHEGGLEHLAPRAMNDIANESPMNKIGMENPAEYLRQVLRHERPHNIAGTGLLTTKVTSTSAVPGHRDGRIEGRPPGVMVVARAAGRDGACKADGRSC